MKFDISRKTGESFEQTISRLTEELKKEGFGIITSVDMKEKFKEKLGVDFRKYTILGACNPQLAYQAIEQEDKIGIMLPCNILVQEHENGQVEVTAMNPMDSIGGTENQYLQALAAEVSAKLRNVTANI